jgi:hypothetical protein
MVAALKDGHGGVGFGSRGAPAPLAWDWIEGRLVITKVPDSQGQPIERGDAVLSIDGKPVEQAIAQAESLISGATPQWIRSRALHEIGVGSANEPLVLEIESFREPGHRQTVTLKRGASGVSETRPEKIAELKPGIYYVDLTRITDGDFADAVPKLAKASGIVFDLRGYPRVGPRWMTHLSDNVADSAQWHVPIITQPDHQNMQFDHRPGWNLQPEKPYFGAKRVVLTAGSAISYAESTMGIVDAYRLATIRRQRHRGDEWQYQSVHAARWIYNYLDRDESAKARWLTASRGWHPADDSRGAHARRCCGRPRRGAGARDGSFTIGARRRAAVCRRPRNMRYGAAQDYLLAVTIRAFRGRYFRLHVPAHLHSHTQSFSMTTSLDPLALTEGPVLPVRPRDPGCCQRSEPDDRAGEQRRGGQVRADCLGRYLAPRCGFQHCRQSLGIRSVINNQLPRANSIRCLCAQKRDRFVHARRL